MAWSVPDGAAGITSFDSWRAGNVLDSPTVRALLPACLVLVAACTQADLYTLTGRESLGPDRLTIEGQLCTDDTGGSRFPVKILLLVDTTQRIFEVDPGNVRFAGPVGGLQAFAARYTNQSHVRFGFVGVGDSIRALPVAGGQTFYHASDPAVADAIAALRTPGGNTRDVVSALAEAESFIQADLGASAPGEVLRTRYLVFFLLSGPPQPAVDAAALAARVQHLRDFVYGKGALELRVDMGFTYYGPLSTIPVASGGYGCFAPAAGDPPCACTPGVPTPSDFCRAQCDVSSGYATAAQNDEARTDYQNIVSLGGGTLTEFACARNIAVPVDVTTGHVQLVRKDLVAFNRNERLTAAGPQVDSDGDGLTDDEEEDPAVGTDPLDWDTDHDGLGDAIELRASPRQNPKDASDRPANCVDPARVASLPDSDLDLLNDCEEGILGTSPSIPDTDGDGLPDALEYFGGMVPTDATDRMLDFDADGIPNGVELIAHTNPRVNEGGLAAQYGNRTRIVDTGARTVASMEDPTSLPGVAFRVAAPNVVGGQAYLKWDPCARTLEWADARGSLPPPTYSPVSPPITIDASGIYRLAAELRVGGNLIDRTWVEVFVTLELMPTCAQSPTPVIAYPLISTSERTCYDVTFGNVKLVPTRAANGATLPGENHVLVFFTEAPADRLASPGVTKVAEVIVRLVCTDPANADTCVRFPADPSITLVDRDFVSVAP
jgi:hypothetical protein